MHREGAVNNGCEGMRRPSSRGLGSRALLKRGGGSGTQKVVYQKWPDQIFLIVSLVLSHDGPFGREGGSL